MAIAVAGGATRDPSTPIAGLDGAVAVGTPSVVGRGEEGSSQAEDAWDFLSSDEDDFSQRAFERGITCDVPYRGSERSIACDLPSRQDEEDRSQVRKEVSAPLTREHRLDSLRRPMTLDDILSPVGGCRVEQSNSLPTLRWPQEVMQLLERPGDVSSRRRTNANTPADAKFPEDRCDFCLDRAVLRPARSGLRLRGGMHAIPHPEKASNGGADSYFVDPDGCGVGIADGVGEWEWRFGVNARAFADELMSGCKDAVRKRSDLMNGQMPGSLEERAMDVLDQGMCATRSFGSSTALAAMLDRNGMLGVANLGDSALMLLRHETDPLVGGRRCIARTREQQHSFNCPYQLSLMPKPEDFPELLRQGKERLVRAIERAPQNSRPDGPGDAELYSLPVQEGDLLILGTDGVFDNLYTPEVCELASHAISPFEAKQGGLGHPTDPAKVAAAIAKAAFHRSMDRGARTPFGDHARQAGFYHTGGKMDDITCVCAWLVHEG